jgi:hypothetical protein
LFSLVALGRAYVPPQTRKFNELLGRVEDLEADSSDLHGRLAKRARVENMATAREAAEAKRAQREGLVEQAAALLQAQREAPPPALDDASARAAMRAKFLTRH